MRVQFFIRKGSYDSLVNELRRGEESIRSMREQLLGKWIKDDIKNEETWLQIVAVEINTENCINKQTFLVEETRGLWGKGKMMHA